jgi:heme oxygenase
MKKLEEMEIREDLLKKIIDIDKQIEDLENKETEKLKELIKERTVLKFQFNSITPEDERID